MSVEVMIYIYLFVCVAMIAFNIVTAIILSERAKRTVRVSEKFSSRIEIQLEKIKNGDPCDEEHKKYMCKKLKRVGNMAAFDQMLESFYSDEPETIKKYLCELDRVFIDLCTYYCGKDRIEAAYFPYIVKKYRILAFGNLPEIYESMLSLLEEPSIYCRENAMQALYTSGDSDYIIKALRKIDRSDCFYHGKLISDGLLNFAGNPKELIDKIIERFDTFSVTMRVTLLNYIRFSSSEYCEFVYSLLCEEKQNDEIRYSAIRYFGKYHWEKAYEKLCFLAKNNNVEKWQYSAIASTALASYPSKETIELLKQNLYSYNWYIRNNSAESLERLGVTYAELADVLDSNDRYAAEILRYRLQCKERCETAV